MEKHRISNAATHLADIANLYLVYKDIKKGALIDVHRKTERNVNRLGLEHNTVVRKDQDPDMVVSRSRSITAQLTFIYNNVEAPERHFLFGELLDYPADAIVSFAAGKSYGYQFGQDITRGVALGRQIPTHLAYIFHVPAYFDFAANGVVSESSVEQGRRYQYFIRSNWPRLAVAIENRFSEQIMRSISELAPLIRDTPGPVVLR